jgi:PAS domain S-box-containing protein
MMWVAGPDGRAIDFNRSWLDFRGRTLAEECGDGWLDGVHPDDREACLKTYRAAVDGRAPFSMEYRLRRGDGVYRSMLENGMPSFDAARTFQGLVGCTVDVTQVKLAEEEVQREREELAHVLRVASLGGLATSLAHEINQPLAAIASNAQAANRLLGESSVDPDVPAALRDIADAAQRAAEIIRRLRVLFRKEHGDPRPVDLEEVIKEVVSLLHKELEHRRVRVQLSVTSGLPRVLGDMVQLQQVILNVCINAAEAMAGSAHPRQLTVTAAAREPAIILITIADTGPGVPAAELQHIFERFVTSKPDGLGMGLSISSSIVTAHGGRIWAMRNPGRGLTIHIELPSLEG